MKKLNDDFKKHGYGWQFDPIERRLKWVPQRTPEFDISKPNLNLSFPDRFCDN